MGKRGVACSVCAHKARHQIDVGLTHGVSHRVLGGRFGLSHDAIGRHAANHLSPVQRAAILAARKPTEIDLDALRVSESEGLLCQLVAQRARLQTHSELAAELGDVRGAVSAEAGIISNLTLVAKLLGQLVNVHDVRHTSILISSDYLALRQAIVAALRPYPDAARAVGAALHRLEAEAATDISAHSSGRRTDTAPLLIEHDAPPAGTSRKRNAGSSGRIDLPGQDELPLPPAPLPPPPIAAPPAVIPPPPVFARPPC